MGKKDGRTLNPADKARKEQRQKEAKKNAERREATRTAIISHKKEDELRKELASIKRAESEGRADGKQSQMKRLIETRLAELEKEKAEQPAQPKSLEEMYPDAEGSIYYHPTDNPYGVPPPGCLPMWKPGYILKSQRHLLPRDHPLHPDFKPAAMHQLPPSSAMDVTEEVPQAPDDDDFDEEDSELALIPLPPEESDSDGDNPPPLPPTTEDDVPGVVYDDEEDDLDDADEGYFEIEEKAPPAKRAPPRQAPAPFPPAHYPPHPKFAGMSPPPWMPLGAYPPPPPPGMFPSYPPPGPGFYPPYGGPPHPRDQPRRSHDSRPPNRGPKKDKDQGGIPDPLDMGPLKNERAPAPPSSKPASTGPSSAHQPSSPIGPSSKSEPKPVDDAVDYGGLVPAALRMKRAAPTSARPVAPRVAPAPTPSAPSPTPPASSYDAFMSSMKQAGAI